MRQAGALPVTNVGIWCAQGKAKVDIAQLLRHFTPILKLA